MFRTADSIIADRHPSLGTRAAMADWPHSSLLLAPRAVLISLIICLCTGVALAQQFAQTSPPRGANSPVPFKDTAAAKTAPPALRRLIEEGNVTLEFTNDPELVSANKGKAHWHWEAKRRFRYRYTTDVKAGVRTVRLTLTEVTQDLERTTRVRLTPKEYVNGPRVWLGRLLRHEFDHVAISSDPRAILLVQYVVQHVPPFDRELPSLEQPSSATLDELVRAELQKRFEAVMAVVNRNNELLDELSQHGLVPVPNRPLFFANLYSEQRLRAVEFPYTDEVAPLLASDEYRNSPLLYVPADPTQPLPGQPRR